MIPHIHLLFLHPLSQGLAQDTFWTAASLRFTMIDGATVAAKEDVPATLWNYYFHTWPTKIME